MRTLAAFILLAALASVSFATYASVIEPVKRTLYPLDSVFIGNAGPGQTVYIVVERQTDGCLTGFCSLGWDQVTVAPEDVPEGWEVEPSPLQETPMKLKIKIGQNSTDGEYNITLRVVDEGNYDGLGNMTIHALVNVSKEVFDIDISPTMVQTGVGQPAIYYITIRNTGAASDPFEIRVKEGQLPAWRFRKSVLVNYGSERVIPYEVVLNEEGEKVFTIEVESLSSPQIHKEETLVIESRSSLITDWKATTHGLLIFPVIEETIYSIVGLLSKLL